MAAVACAALNMISFPWGVALLLPPTAPRVRTRANAPPASSKHANAPFYVRVVVCCSMSCKAALCRPWWACCMCAWRFLLAVRARKDQPAPVGDAFENCTVS